MGNLAALATDDVLQRVLGTAAPGHADVLAELRAAHDAACGAVDHQRLERCRVRIAQLLGCEAEASSTDDELAADVRQWPTDPRFDAVDRACLALTEQVVVDVASMDDATVEAVRSHLGDAGTQDFVSALLVVEQRIRLRLIWDRLLGGR